VNRIAKSGGAAAFALLLMLAALPVFAAETKIAVINIQDVLLKSAAGAAAKEKIEKRMKELRDSLDKDKQDLMTLQDEMKKKSAVWSEEKKQEQGVEFQKKRREFEAKQDNANLEMKNLQDQQLAPIMKQLEGIVKEVAKTKGVAIVLPNNAVLYSDSSADITGEVIQALNSQK
jgi:outer membrane protein